jgi:diaminohydroxyphosphoribosylaminopyrimidine deaminase/5-amino-6-(5-phosphoribosylamino)uracil reductase
MPLSAEMLALPGETLVYCTTDTERRPLVDAGAEVIKVKRSGGHVDAAAVLADLGSRGVNYVLVEAGPTLAGNLLASRLVDELVIYQAPHIMGSETIGMFETPEWTHLSDRRLLEICDTRAVGPDTRITARLRG